ncbi:Perq amino acid-rich with gyf domain-containing protein, partial [Globisporangium splendens]
MMKRDDGDDDFVTKTAKHRKKHTTSGSGGGATSEDPGSSKSEKHTTVTEGKPPAGPGGSNASTSASSEGISLRPRTMFAMKGRGRTESEGSAYRPQWSKDGEGFVTAATSNASNATAGQGKDANAAQDPQGAADASRRKSKVLRYTKEELLALHFTTTSPPEFPPETLVACDLALPPVSTLPFDYEEIYKQWALNRNRGRGRGRGTGAGNATDGQQQSDRSRSNGKWEEGGNKTAKNDGDEQQPQGDGDSTWQRGFKVTEPSSGSRDDVWDDVGALGGSDSNEMDLSSMAEAAERFRREMDAMREELNPPVLKDNNTDLDEFDKKLESAAAAGQFEDSDEEVQWDDPTDLGGGLGGDRGPLFFEDASTAKSQFGIIDTKQFPLVEEKSFSLQQLGGEPLSSLESLRVEVRDEWFYLDPQGLQQGPFKSIEMREWFEAGYFKPHLPIRFGREGAFTPLANQFLHGQVPFSGPPQPSPKVAAENERQRLYALQQEQQRQELQQQQQMLQLQQQQEHQRLLQLNQEEKIRMEMQRLEIARQQQSHLYQQQQQQMHQQQMLQQQQQQQQHHHQQQQHMLLQQQSSWQRMQREGIMSALGIFGGEQDQRGIPANESFHGMQTQFQSDFRTQHHLGAHDPVLRDSLFLNDSGARQQQNEFWQSSSQQPVLGESLFHQGQQQQQQQHNPLAEMAQLHTQEKADVPLDPWGKPKTDADNSFSLYEIQNEEKRRAAEEVRNALSSPEKQEEKQVVSPTPPKPVAPKQPQAPQSQASQSPASQSQASQKQTGTPAKENTKKSKNQAKAAENNGNDKGAWVDPTAAPAKSLKDIQKEEQQELRKKMEETSNSTNLEQMGAQLKMMLGVQSLAAPSPPQPQSPAPAAPSSSGGGASPWGVPVATAQPTIASKQSLRDIQAEEERLAQERARKNEGGTSSNSHWVNVVAGTSVTPAPKPVRSSLGPVPVSVLKSRQQIRATNGADSSAPKTSPTPAKVESDASFWNFGAAQTAKASSSGSATTDEVKVSNAFGNTAVSSEFMTWAAKQFQAISGREDLTLMEYCASLEDPGEIREYLAAYLGSTPRVSAFATEFIQRKKKGSSFPSSSGPSLKKSPSSASAKSQDDDVSTGKKGKRRGGKGQKIDPSLLNFV